MDYPFDMGFLAVVQCEILLVDQLCSMQLYLQGVLSAPTEPYQGPPNGRLLQCHSDDDPLYH